MKKLLVVALAALLMLACLPASAEMLMIANPWRDVENLAVLNELAGTELCTPPVMGVTDIECSLMDDGTMKLAELRFCVNGTPYTMRGAVYGADISGFYVDQGGTAFETAASDALALVEADGCKLARWFVGDVQYVLMVTDEGTMASETFASIAGEMAGLTGYQVPATIEEGTYYDRVSGRAYAIVKAADAESWDIEIHWGDSADVDHMWLLTAAFADDGSLAYTNCTHTRVQTLADGTVIEAVADTIPTGSFDVVDGALCWNGAAEPSCRDCVFVKADE